MCFTLTGLVLLAFAGNYALILLAVCVIGIGSSVFHPEAARVGQMASGGRKSLAQSIFQVGGNGGSAVGPLLAAAIVLPFGQQSIAIFALAAVAAAILLLRVGYWYSARLTYQQQHNIATPRPNTTISRRRKHWSLFILVMLIFSKYFYTACITSGTVAGGMFGDRFGRKYVIWFSILGAAPFALAMPYTGLALTVVCAVMSGLVIASAFSSIVVYATDLFPDKVGLVCGVFFGLMFGLGGIGSAFFGWLADLTSIEYIFSISSLLPLLGVIAGFLPDMQHGSRGNAQ